MNEGDKFASVLGYIVRSLVKGHNYSLLHSQLVKVMQRDGVILSPDIAVYLKYLEDEGYIEYTDDRVTSYTAYADNAMIRLTAKGVRLVGGRITDAGIDL